MSVRTRADLDALPGYVPGRTIPGAIKLASNEVSLGPLPSVVEAIAQAARHINRYPDSGASELVARLARKLDVSEDQVAVGCGSVTLCQQLVQATCTPDDEVMFAWRSFEAYPIAAAAAAATSVKVPVLADGRHDLDAMAAAITDRTRLILVCNPNNPTGTAVRRGELEHFLDQVPSDVLVVIDEAYREFVTDAEVPDALELFGDRPNVAVLRTLSKAWGLAGLRVGWLAAAPEVADAVRKVVTPFSTNAVGQAAALAALGAAAEMRRRVDLVVAERERVHKAVLALVPDVPPTQANFVWLPLRDRAAGFAAACEQRGVIVRAFPGDGVRVTTGTPEENDAFLAAAEAALTA